MRIYVTFFSTRDTREIINIYLIRSNIKINLFYLIN